MAPSLPPVRARQPLRAAGVASSSRSSSSSSPSASSPCSSSLRRHRCDQRWPRRRGRAERLEARVLERPSQQGDGGAAAASPQSTGAGTFPDKLDVWSVAGGLKDAFHEEDLRSGANLARVLEAFQSSRVGAHHVNAQASGYGCGDVGKEALDRAAARLWGCERAAVRANIVSGTHAITCALFGALRPGDILLSCTGDPYDTLEEVIGVRAPPADNGAHSCGTLLDWGIEYRKVDLLGEPAPLAETQSLPQRLLDSAAIEEALAAANPRPTVVYVQRSCGYGFRRTVKVAEIEQVRTISAHSLAQSPPPHNFFPAAWLLTSFLKTFSLLSGIEPCPEWNKAGEAGASARGQDAGATPHPSAC